MVDILGIGASGLSAYRKLLETVGGNITNATTDGYVRRDVQLSVAGDSTMMPTSAPSTSGSGVVVDSVRRNRSVVPVGAESHVGWGLHRILPSRAASRLGALDRI